MARPRANLDKTSRAVVHAAVKIALMKRACQKELPHAGFVLMHSPFPAGREGDAGAIATVIKSRFYETLAGHSDGQIIVVERGGTKDLSCTCVQRSDFAEPGK